MLHLIVFFLSSLSKSSLVRNDYNTLTTIFAYRLAAQLAAQLFAHLVVFENVKNKIRVILVPKNKTSQI
jgi:hypothetical protein